MREAVRKMYKIGILSLVDLDKKNGRRRRIYVLLIRTMSDGTNSILCRILIIYARRDINCIYRNAIMYILLVIINQQIYRNNKITILSNTPKELLSAKVKLGFIYTHNKIPAEWIIIVLFYCFFVFFLYFARQSHWPKHANQRPKCANADRPEIGRF